MHVPYLCSVIGKKKLCKESARQTLLLRREDFLSECLQTLYTTGGFAMVKALLGWDVPAT
jgi:hypothetical protein